jgi:predicted glycoside hydrolase/deacetylase ChbG (UPF0249 family)
MTRLLVNCDDLGMHSSINAAIVELLHSGPVRSASLMATGAYFTDAVERLHQRGIRAIGVHLALGNEYPALRTRPVSPRSAGASFVTKEGFLWPMWLGPLPVTDVDAAAHELEAQVARVVDAGLRPTHFDGHLFFYEPTEHGSPELLEVVATLARRFGVPFRSVSEPRRGPVDRTHFIWEGFDTPQSRWEHYDHVLGTLTSGTHELILHPGEDEIAMRAFTGAAHRRRADYLYCFSGRLEHALAQSGVTVVGWQEL